MRKTAFFVAFALVSGIARASETKLLCAQTPDESSFLTMTVDACGQGAISYAISSTSVDQNLAEVALSLAPSAAVEASPLRPTAKQETFRDSSGDLLVVDRTVINALWGTVVVAAPSGTQAGWTLTDYFCD